VPCTPKRFNFRVNPRKRSEDRFLLEQPSSPGPTQNKCNKLQLWMAYKTFPQPRLYTKMQQPAMDRISPPPPPTPPPPPPPSRPYTEKCNSQLWTASGIQGISLSCTAAHALHIKMQQSAMDGILASTRYCHRQYGMVYGMKKEGSVGGLVLLSGRAIVL